VKSGLGFNEPQKAGAPGMKQRSNKVRRHSRVAPQMASRVAKRARRWGIRAIKAGQSR